MKRTILISMVLFSTATDVAVAAADSPTVDVEAGVTVLPFAADGYYLKAGWQLPNTNWQVFGAVHRNRVYRVDDTNAGSATLRFDQLQYHEFAFDLGIEKPLCNRSGTLCWRLGAFFSGARTGDADNGLAGAPVHRLTFARVIGRAALDVGWPNVRVRLGFNLGPGYGWRSDGASDYSGDGYVNLAFAARI